MIETVDVQNAETLDDYAAVVHYAPSVYSLRTEANALLRRLSHRKIWMVNSTPRGGGVAEMLPKVVSILRELGVPTEWVAAGTSRPEFFELTKRIHNLIHGKQGLELTNGDRELYEAVSRENADELKGRIQPDDILVIHDPQPLGMGAMLSRELGIPTIFRCHIGLDQDVKETRAAWDFLSPYANSCSYSIFSASEYIPGFLAGRSGVIHPAIDPMSPKNKELGASHVAGILSSARLDDYRHPVVMPPFPTPAQRLCPDGEFRDVSRSGGIGLLFRPVVTQVSRWDHLKGFQPLIQGFLRMKQILVSRQYELDEHHRRRLELVRLVLVGPDPAAIQDDPEAQEVLQELIGTYRCLPPQHQEDVALISLPMNSLESNALMVNALQRCSTIVVQNSIREGFGLTVTEAMWKRSAVLGTRACGIRKQIRDGIDGRLTQNPEDPDEIAYLMNSLLEGYDDRGRYGLNAQRRVHDEFLIFTQVRRWLQVLAEHAAP
jgi:trehalose synthase